MRQTVGDERDVDDPLHHWMAAILDFDQRRVGQSRAGPVQGFGAFRQIGDDIECRDTERAGLQRGQGLRESAEQFLIERLLPRQGTLAAAQNLILEPLELRGDIAFRVFQSLTAHIIQRRPTGLRAMDLDVITVDAVIADLESGQTGALAFAGLQLQQEAIGVARQVAQLIQLRVETRGDHATVADQHRRLGEDGAREQVEHLGMIADVGIQAGEQRFIHPGQQVMQTREDRE